MATSRRSTKISTTHVGSVSHEAFGFFAVKVAEDSYLLDIVYFKHDTKDEILKPDSIVHTGIVGENLLDIVDSIESLIHTGMFMDIPPIHVGIVLDGDTGEVITDVYWCQFTDVFKELEAHQFDIFGDEFPIYNCEGEDDQPMIEITHKPTIKSVITLDEVMKKTRIPVPNSKSEPKIVKKAPAATKKPVAKTSTATTKTPAKPTTKPRTSAAKQATKPRVTPTKKPVAKSTPKPVSKTTTKPAPKKPSTRTTTTQKTTRRPSSK